MNVADWQNRPQNSLQNSTCWHLLAHGAIWPRKMALRCSEFSTAQLGAALKNTGGRWPSIGIRIPVSTSTISRILTCKHHGTQLYSLYSLYSLARFALPLNLWLSVHLLRTAHIQPCPSAMCPWPSAYPALRIIDGKVEYQLKHWHCMPCLSSFL